MGATGESPVGDGIATAEELEKFMDDLDKGIGNTYGSKYDVGGKSFRNGGSNKNFSPILCASLVDSDDTALLETYSASNVLGFSPNSSVRLQSTHYKLTQQIPDDVQLPATAQSLDLDSGDLEPDDQLTTKSSLPSIPAAPTPLSHSSRNSERFHRRPIPKLNDVDQDGPLPVHERPNIEGDDAPGWLQS